MILQMNDILHCKRAIIYLAEANDDKLCKLLLKRWNILKELILILQVPYKATVELQRQALTLPDAFGIWQKMLIHLDSNELKRKCNTNFRECLIKSITERKQPICDNEAMYAALFMDPRYHNYISRDEEKVDLAKTFLKKLWNRMKFLHEKEANNQRFESIVYFR